jgi:phage gp36-like protein
MSEYCNVNDVKRYLPSAIVVEGNNPTPDPFDPNPENMKVIDIEQYIVDASSRIDMALSTMYDTPLKKINEGGIKDFPGAIRNICSILASQMIFEKELQGADRQRSESQKEREKWAEGELLLIQNGERRLKGQRCTRGSRFVRGTLYDIVKNPAVEGQSRGNK